MYEQSLPADGIKVFASQLHTHLTGLRAYTKHYRNGVELLELNRDNHFSPHYQEIRKLARQVHVMPVSCLLFALHSSCLVMLPWRRRSVIGSVSP